jgi:hypothetical protein
VIGPASRLSRPEPPPMTRSGPRLT